jgi:flagellar hook-associated protein 1 FlgK
MQDIFVGGTNGLGQAINDMINAFSDVANAPTDLTARTVAITRAQKWPRASERQHPAQRPAAEHPAAAQGRPDRDQLAGPAAGQPERADLRALSSGQPPNDLLDKRDNLLSQLNQKVQTTTVKVDDGTISVFVASQPLVLGTRPPA